MRTLLLAALILLPAAGAAARDVPGDVTYLPDGKAAYAVTCNGPFDGMKDCARRAGEICRETGYAVVDESRRAADLPEPLAQLKRSMTIRCRTPDGLYPADRDRR